jgi:hypothetical protein
MVSSHAAAIPRMRIDREPHIGEYDAKTNAVAACDFSQGPSRQNEADNGPAAAIAGGECCFYCPWFFST